MTSIAVTASMCASVSEVALLVASFMPVFSLNLGATNRGAKTRTTVRIFTRNTPRRVFALLESPHSANIDCAKVEHYCGGNLTRPCRGTDTVWAKSSPNRKDASGKHREPNGPHRL